MTVTPLALAYSDDSDQVVATLGSHTLYREDDENYRLEGPDANFSRAWLTAVLPDGPWFTEWGGCGRHFTLLISR